MTYARIEQNAVVEYPVYEGEIRLRYSNVSFPTPFVASKGYELVADATPPAYDYRSNVDEGTPVLTNGTWTRNWLVTPANDEQIAERTAAQWGSVRFDRNTKLENCDWTQLPDAPLSNIEMQQWAAYRQALRDITTQTDPFAIVWPETPGA